jgi:hypothetical protein
MVRRSYWKKSAGARTKGLSPSIMKADSYCSANTDRKALVKRTGNVRSSLLVGLL